MKKRRKMATLFKWVFGGWSARMWQQHLMLFPVLRLLPATQVSVSATRSSQPNVQKFNVIIRQQNILQSRVCLLCKFSLHFILIFPQKLLLGKLSALCATEALVNCNWAVMLYASCFMLQAANAALLSFCAELHHWSQGNWSS